MDNEPLNTPAEKKNYSFKIDEGLYLQMEKLLRYLKFIDNHSQSIQRWLIEAFKEKLSLEPAIPLTEGKNEKFITVKLDKHLREKIESRVQHKRKSSGGYTIKQWMVEAIHEKVQRDSETTEKTRLVEDKAKLFR